MTTKRDPDNQDQPPEVDIRDPARQHSDPAEAAGRVLEFVGWFGDGQIWHAEHDGPTPTLYARDLEALARTVQELRASVEKVRLEMLAMSNDDDLPIQTRSAYRDANRAIYAALNRSAP
jgi:hypothetical protein